MISTESNILLHMKRHKKDEKTLLSCLFGLEFIPL